MLLKWHRGNAPNHVARHFHLREFECHCKKCEVQQVNTDLLDKLDSLRDELGAAILIHSGYRCAEHNKAVGGKRNSHHLSGLAADISAKSVTILELEALCEKHFTGIGIAHSFIHCDVAPRKAKWFY